MRKEDKRILIVIASMIGFYFATPFLGFVMFHPLLNSQMFELNVQLTMASILFGTLVYVVLILKKES